MVTFTLTLFGLKLHFAKFLLTKLVVSGSSPFDITQLYATYGQSCYSVGEVALQNYELAC